MSKIIYCGSAILLAAIVGIAFAQGMWRNSGKNWNSDIGNDIGKRQVMMQYHAEMYQIMEEGTYADFSKFREETGFNMMPWVQSEEDFSLAKQMHEKMEKFHEESGFKGKGGCPMMG